MLSSPHRRPFSALGRNMHGTADTSLSSPLSFNAVVCILTSSSFHRLDRNRTPSWIGRASLKATMVNHDALCYSDGIKLTCSVLNWSSTHYSLFCQRGFNTNSGFHRSFIHPLFQLGNTATRILALPLWTYSCSNHLDGLEDVFHLPSSQATTWCLLCSIVTIRDPQMMVFLILSFSSWILFVDIKWQSRD